MSKKAPSPHLALKKPVSVLNKPMKADARGLFAALGKAAKNGFTGKWADAAADAAGAMEALDLKTSPGELAWVLIRQSLLRAMHGMLGQIAHSLNTGKASPGTSARLDEALAQADLVLDSNFFRRPRELALLKDVAELLRQWLADYGLNDAQAGSVAGRLPANFVYALSQEWRENAARYAPVLKAAETPFLFAGEQEQAWEAYGAWLQQQVEESLFQEPFGLTQVYVQPRAFFEKKKRDAKAGLGDCDSPGAARETVKVVVGLEEHLDAWLGRGDKADALRVLSGGPGSGKSCFAKMFAARQAGQGRRVLYMPLHLLDAKGELVSEAGKVLLAGGILGHNPLASENGEERLLLILDGLDELAMLGKIAENMAQAFVRQVEQHLNRRNQDKLRLQVIITGRTVVIEANALEFRREGQLLHLLSYVEKPSEGFQDPKKLLAEDQRDAWWKLYGLATGTNYAGLPTDLAREDLVEVTAQPLLCLLVALSYERKRVDFSKEVNLNVVYADLLEAIYERPWGGGDNFAVKAMTFPQFCRVLEEIGLAAWHGNGRSTTVGEIRQHCDSAKISRLLDVFQEGAEAGVTRLLAAFYFRQNGVRKDEQAFEFTHKSFGEYLAARRIVGALERMSKDFVLHSKGALDEGWDESQALQHWAVVCGPAVLERNIVRFLRQEVALKEVAKAAEWQQTLCALIPFMLRRGMPMEKLSLTYGEASRQARNAEEALLVALSACAERTRRVSDVKWPEPASFGTWIRRLQPQAEACLALSALTWLDLRECEACYLDLVESNLEHSILEAVAGGNLIATSAEMAGANLQRGNLQQAVFRGANLRGADLRGANLEWADLRDADLRGANLGGVNLRGASLRGADLREVNLQESNLWGAELWDANLRGADLRGVDLDGVDLDGVNFKDARLEGAQFSQPILPGAVPEGGNPQA